MTNQHRALQGINILDLTQAVAGPYCTRLLAGYGASVLKIERPGRGDITRHAGPFLKDIPNPEAAGLFLHLNGGKRSITLNLKSQTGRAIFLRLLESADVVVESYRPGAMTGFGLDYTTLAGCKPHIILVSISNFGQTGPYRDYEAVDLISQAFGGPLMYAQGYPNKSPLKYAGNTGQYYAGLAAALAAVAAAGVSKWQGVGQHVDISIIRALMSSPEHKPIISQYTGEPSRRVSNDDRSAYLMGAYPCKDGFIGVQGSGRGETWWPRVYRMMGMPELIEDPRFSTPADREANRDEFDALWYSWLAEHTRQEIFAAANEARYPLAPVYTPADLLTDPHFKARGFFERVRQPAVGELVRPGAPFKMSATPWLPSLPAPSLGEHNEQVYVEQLGYSKRQLVQMRMSGVI